MDLPTIIIMALSGFTGALAGFLLSAFLGPVFGFGGDSFRRFSGAIVVILGIAVGLRFIAPWVTPYLHPSLSDMLAGVMTATEENSETASASLDTAPVEPEAARPDQTLVDEKVRQAMASFDDPVLLALMKREPDRSNGISQRFEGAYIRGGDEALAGEADQIRIEVGTVSIPFYLARARDEDLVAAAMAMRDAINKINEADPQTCHLWVYGAMLGESFDYDRYLTAIGPVQHQALQQKLAAAILNAYEYVPEYQEGEAVQQLATIGQEIYERLGDEKIGLLTSAQAPQSVEDAHIACEATASMYDSVLALDSAPDILRHMFMYGQQGY